MKKVIYSILSAIVLSIIFIPNVFAESNLNYSVSVEPALNITTSSDKVSLDLNPLTHDFDSQNLNISISTNNPYGYKLYVNANTTSLTEKNDNTLYIETLDSEKSESDFTVNKWGYKLNTGNYLPFKSGTLLSYSYEAIENSSTTMTFAAKVDYETKAGSYSLPLNFQATANPNIRYMQNFTSEDCKILASDNSYTVYDLRDENNYQVRYINGNCWMVQNLRFSKSELKKDTTNIDADKTITWYDLTGGNAYSAARYHNSNDTAHGYWYNYAGASAMTITGSSNTSTQTYDICPKNWRLPTRSDFISITGYSSEFSVVTGGSYYDGVVNDTQGAGWWSATPGDGDGRYRLLWNGTELSANYYFSRRRGYFVRCIRSS